jgi:hypothetical protein
VAVDDFDGFDEAYSPDDFSQADMDFATAVGQQTGGYGDDNTAQEIANYLAQPQTGTSPRSNIVGSSTYDPTFAAALDISRGLDPTGNFQGTGGLAVPSYLRPQIESGRVDARGEPIRYSSGFERFLQEDLTDAIRSTQKTIAGIPSLYSLGIDAIKSVFDGASFLNDSKAGKTVQEQADDQKRIEIADLEKNRLDPLQTDMTDPNFKPLDKLDDRPSAQDALNAISNMFDNKGIVSLSQADNLKNQQIAAGEKIGQSLVDAPPRKSDVFPMSGGFILSGISSDPTPTVNPRDNPRDPNNPGGTMLTFPDPINDPVKAPPGFVDIVMREGKSPTFAGTDISIFGGRDPSAKLYSPLTEAEAQAQIDTGFSLEPIDFPSSLSPRDFTASGVRAGVDLTPADFRVEQSGPEKVIRVPKSSLPASAQELASLRSGELDYGTSFPLQTILDARREKRFTQKELGDLLAGFKR